MRKLWQMLLLVALVATQGGVWSFGWTPTTPTAPAVHHDCCPPEHCACPTAPSRTPPCGPKAPRSTPRLDAALEGQAVLFVAGEVAGDHAEPLENRPRLSLAAERGRVSRLAIPKGLRASPVPRRLAWLRVHRI